MNKDVWLRRIYGPLGGNPYPRIVVENEAGKEFYFEVDDASLMPVGAKMKLNREDDTYTVTSHERFWCKDATH